VSTAKPNWWAGLRCRHCGEAVTVSDAEGGTSFHRTLCWAEHHPPSRKPMETLR
jgi:hypothetical protein